MGALTAGRDTLCVLRASHHHLLKSKNCEQLLDGLLCVVCSFFHDASLTGRAEDLLGGLLARGGLKIGIGRWPDTSVALVDERMLLIEVIIHDLGRRQVHSDRLAV